MRRIGVVTVGRSDYGIFQPVLRAIAADPALELCLIVTGAHLSPGHGLTVREVERDFSIAARVEMLLASDTPAGVTKSIGVGLLGFAQVYERLRPDILLVLGDRFETMAAALSALPFTIPVAHLHGGELSQGAMDDALRHAITKLSHLHFVATADYARRVIQLGEEPWRVTVSGAPGLDHLDTIELLPLADLNRRYDLGLARPPLLVTYHPVTLEYEQTETQVGELMAALEDAGLPVVFTAPNADPGSHIIQAAIAGYVQAHPEARLVENLGTVGYFSMMAAAAAMVGNSSSGIIEAASFRLPVVNIGTRQQGRTRGANVIDTGYSRAEILAGIRRATDPAFRESLRDLVNPYRGHRPAAAIIVERLKTVPLDAKLTRKRFYDLEFVPGTGGSHQPRE